MTAPLPDPGAVQRHIERAERLAAQVPGVTASVVPRPVDAVAIVGAGTMGSGIAMSFLNAGIPVRLLETSRAALDRGVGAMRRNYEAQLARGKLDARELQRRWALLDTRLDWEDLGHADLAIEAVFEAMSVKEKVFRRLDAVMKPGAMLASNTSTLDVDCIAGFTSRPQDVLGLHFFSPAQVMKLLEVVRGARTAPDVLATAMQLARRIGKTAVVAGVCDGFIGNRLVAPYSRQAGLLLDEGATPQQVDRAIEAFGFAMGPFRMSDLAGNDIGWAIRKARMAEGGSRALPRYSKTADRLCERGRFGQKTCAGWYDYAPGGREAIPSPEVDEIIRAWRSEIGVKARSIGDEEIAQRLVYALVNEGARVLAEGIAARASDIDLVYLAGYGFPKARGGPMYHADTVGLARVIDHMRGFQQNPMDDASFWEPAPLLQALAAQGRTFNQELPA